MEKQKQAHSRKIDALIVACVVGSECDEAEMVRLAIEYATMFRSPYQMSASHMRSLETPEEKTAALQLEAKVNNVITKTMRQLSSMSTMGRLSMERFSMQPGSGQRPIMQSCKCTGPNRSPNCKMPSELCKFNRSTLSASVPRSTSERSSTKKGGKSKSKRFNKRLNRSKKANRY